MWRRNGMVPQEIPDVKWKPMRIQKMSRLAYADSIAAMMFVMENYRGRLILPVKGAPSRDAILDIYTEIYNMFGGDIMLLSNEWAVRMDYRPDISLPIDAYRMVFMLIPRFCVNPSEHRGKLQEPIAVINSIDLQEEGVRVMCDNFKLIIEVDHEAVQRAYDRRKEEIEADPSGHPRPVSQPPGS